MAGTAPEMTADVYYWLIKYEAECGRKLDSNVLARMTGKTVNAAGLTVMRMKKKFEASGHSLDAGSGGAGGGAEEVKQAKPKRASPKKRKAEADDGEEYGKKIKSEATDGGDSGTECWQNLECGSHNLEGRPAGDGRGWKGHRRWCDCRIADHSPGGEQKAWLERQAMA